MNEHDLDGYLDDLRTEYTPGPEDKARMDRRLTAAIGLPVGLGAGASTSGAVKGAGLTSLFGGATSLKWGAALVVVGLGAGVYGWNEQHRTDTAKKAATTVSVSDDAADADHAPEPPAHELPRAAEFEPTAAGTPAAEDAGTSTAPVEVPQADKIAAPNVRGSIGAASPETSDGGRLQAAASAGDAPERRKDALEEIELIFDARQQLKAGNADRAAQLLTQHGERFPSGQLAPERQGLLVLIRCQQSRDPSAQSEATRFLAAHPLSPLGPSLRTSCLGQ